jgi:outer membrane protein assembly factor BamE (lipoprotein component of BamABCDE complex)
MMKISAKKWVLIGFVLLCSLLLLTGCGQSAGQKDSSDQTAGQTTEKESTDQAAENVSDFFNKVQIGQTKEEVDAILGVTPTSPLEGAFDYVDENGNGVTVIFMERSLGDGSPKVALSKKLIGAEKYITETPDDQRITEEQADKIIEGMTYDEVKTILGQPGIVVSEAEGTAGAITTERYWIKPGLASMLSVTFAGQGGSDLSSFILNF